MDDNNESLYDYGQISNADKKLVEEFIKLLEVRQGVPIPVIVNELKTKFELEEYEYAKVEDGKWHELTHDFTVNIQYHHQGFKQIQVGDGKVLRIPHLGFGLDLDNLNELAEHIENKVKNNGTRT
tara:strand:+ start:818 stop:1192 length:375 start_codon:yes stop_codon:yes gene_type:complete